MIHTTKLVQLGKGLVVVLPKDFVSKYNLGKGDTVQLHLELLDILKEPKPDVEYRCQRCQYRFTDNDENPECPSCGCLDVKEVRENGEAVE